MRLNLRGQALGRGHIDGVPLPDIGGTDYCWLTEDVPICAAGNTIQKYQGGAWQLVASHGANLLRAGHGRYFTELGGWAPTDVDPADGTAVLTHYDIGRDIRLVAMDGTSRDIATGVLGRDAIAYHNARRRFGFLLYQADAVWSLFGPGGAAIPILPRVDAVDYAVPVQANGRVLLLERANGRLSLRRPDTTLGWLVHEDFASDGLVVPDGIAIADMTIRVSWSNKQSEAANVWAVANVILDDSRRIDLNARIIPTPEDAMPYAILKKQAAGDPVIWVEKLSEEQKDGKLYLNKQDGKKVSMQPDGTIQDRPHDNYGPWEEFIKTPKGYVAAAHGEKYGIATL